MEYTKNEYYRLKKAKEKVKKLKDFYRHVVVTLIAIPVVVFVNLKFSPQFHWFWIAIWGMGFSLIMHWVGNFIFGKDWEEQKIKEIINNTKHKN